MRIVRIKNKKGAPSLEGLKWVDLLNLRYGESG